MGHEKNTKLLEALNNCANECNHCATACLDEQNVNELTKCIKLDLDCADICTLTTALLARGSAHGKHILKECAEICNNCADECEKHAAMGMDHCRKCAEACRACAAACQEMM